MQAETTIVTETETADEETQFDHTATFSPEDDKLRLYPAYRLSKEDYARVKRLGFTWAPKQELFVAIWSPRREDLLLEWCGNIGDEDYSPEERAADRAERFSGYRDKRRGEAGGLADRFESGPSAFGHQNRGRAERQAARHDRLRVHSVNQWSKAEYWQQRTQGVISNALHKSSAPVRRGRLLRLEAEQRKHEKSVEEYAAAYRQWSEVLTLDGADQPIAQTEKENHIGIDRERTSPAARLAYALSNTSSRGISYVHPRTGKESSLYCHMTISQDPITAAEAANLWLEDCLAPDDEEGGMFRWSQHYALRIEYETAMLANEGGMVADLDIEAGGWFGKSQVQRVHKSPVTKRVVSCDFFGPPSYGAQENPDGTPRIVLHNINIERMGEKSYRAPTEEEREAFRQQETARKADAKAKKGKVISLINPTDEDAQRLQDIWNQQAAAKRKTAVEPSEVWRMTQAEYSARSKGTYGLADTLTVSENCNELSQRCRSGRVGIFKVRKACGSGWAGAHRVIVLTDKTQSPIPWEAIEEAKLAQPTREDVLPRLQELVTAMGKYHGRSPEEEQLILDAQYVGLARDTRFDSPGLTEAGANAYMALRAAANPKACGKELVTA